nr:MAG TPA: hypothetical protein [Caudoviricetes sp.]
MKKYYKILDFIFRLLVSIIGAYCGIKYYTVIDKFITNIINYFKYLL